MRLASLGAMRPRRAVDDAGGRRAADRASDGHGRFHPAPAITGGSGVGSSGSASTTLRAPARARAMLASARAWKQHIRKRTPNGLPLLIARRSKNPTAI